MRFTVVWGVESLAALRRLRAEDALGANVVAAAVRGLEIEARPVDSRRFGGTEFYRLRVGEYRVFYEIKESVGIIRLLNVGRVPPSS